MIHSLRISLFAASIAVLSACAGMMPAAGPAKVDNGALVGSNGMTLYTFDRDAAGSAARAFATAPAPPTGPLWLLPPEPPLRATGAS